MTKSVRLKLAQQKWNEPNERISINIYSSNATNRGAFVGVIKNFNLFDLFDLFGGGGTGAIARYFTELTSTGSQYYTIPSYTISSTGSIEIESVTTTTGVAYDYLNGFGVTTGDIFSVPAGCSDVLVDGVSVGTTGAAPKDGELHTIEFTILTGSGALTNIGSTATPSSYFDGIIASVKITGAGTLVRHYKINESWADDLVLKDAQTVLGSELFPEPPNTIQAGWTDNGGGSYTHTGASSEIQETPAGLVEDMAYIISMTIAGVSPNVTMQLGGAPTNGFNKEINLGAGTHYFVLRAETVSFDAIRCITATDCTVSNISIKEASGYGEAVNITSADAEKYKFSGSVSPNTWTGVDSATVIEVAGT